MLLHPHIAAGPETLMRLEHNAGAQSWSYRFGRVTDSRTFTTGVGLPTRDWLCRRAEGQGQIEGTCWRRKPVRFLARTRDFHSGK
jgi:hypothetical protein